MSRIVVLGAGTPTPTPARFGSSYVVELNGQHLMFDCGPAQKGLGHYICRIRVANVESI